MYHGDGPVTPTSPRWTPDDEARTRIDLNAIPEEVHVLGRGPVDRDRHGGIHGVGPLLSYQNPGAGAQQAMWDAARPQPGSIAGTRDSVRHLPYALPAPPNRPYQPPELVPIFPLGPAVCQRAVDQMAGRRPGGRFSGASANGFTGPQSEEVRLERGLRNKDSRYNTRTLFTKNVTSALNFLNQAVINFPGTLENDLADQCVTGAIFAMVNRQRINDPQEAVPFCGIKVRRNAYLRVLRNSTVKQAIEDGLLVRQEDGTYGGL
jgi:hypothetical protein